MNRGRMLLLAVVALVLSAGLTYVTYQFLQTRIQPAGETVDVVVASKRLSIGNRVTAEDIRVTAWPKGTPLEGSFNQTTAVVGRGVVVTMMPNEPVLESKLAPVAAGAGLAAVIPEGMRAVAISVNNIIGVAGFVLPGSRVDVILTGMPPEAISQETNAADSKTREEAAKIVLENIQVLAAGQNVQRDSGGQAQPAQVVTLLLTPEQAAKVALATAGAGTIQLALRNPLDLEKVDTPLIYRSALYSGNSFEPVVETRPAKAASARPRSAPVKTAASAPPPPPPSLPRVFDVELIHGANRSTLSFKEQAPDKKSPDVKVP